MKTFTDYQKQLDLFPLWQFVMPAQHRNLCAIGLIGNAGTVSTLLYEHTVKGMAIHPTALIQALGKCAQFGAWAAALMDMPIDEAIALREGPSVERTISTFQLQRTATFKTEASLKDTSTLVVMFATAALTLAQANRFRTDNGTHLLYCYFDRLAALTTAFSLDLAGVLQASLEPTP